MTPQQLSEQLWQFAARIAKVVDGLPETRVGRHVASQVSIERSEILKRFFGERSRPKK
jgi:hypothetical protein